MKSKNRESPGGRIAPILRREIRSPEHKRDYNRRLFTVVAPKYDVVTRVLSFGQDRRWKRVLLMLLPQRLGALRTEGVRPAALDLACGTGDITFLLADRYPRAEIVGLDLTAEMLIRARRRAGHSAGGHAGSTSPDGKYGNVRFVTGDMNNLSAWVAAGAGTVDLVTGGYALRNAPDLRHTLSEVARVLRPGGTAAFLDFSLPAGRRHRAIQVRLVRFWGQVWGCILHRDPEVYAYIARSLENFVDDQALDRLMRSAGLTPAPGRSLMFGFVRITRARKPAQPQAFR